MEANHTASRAGGEVSGYSLGVGSPCLGTGTGGSSMGISAPGGDTPVFGGWSQLAHAWAPVCGDCVGGVFPGKRWSWLGTRRVDYPSGFTPTCTRSEGDCSGGAGSNVVSYGPCERTTSIYYPPMSDIKAGCPGGGPCSIGRQFMCGPVYYWCRDGGTTARYDCEEPMDERYGCCGPYCTAWEADTKGKKDCEESSESSQSESSATSSPSESSGGTPRYYIYCCDVWQAPCVEGVRGEDVFYYSNQFVLYKNQVCVADGGTNDGVPNPNSPSYEYGCDGGHYSIGCNWAMSSESHFRYGPFPNYEIPRAYVLAQGGYSSAKCSERR